MQISIASVLPEDAEVVKEVGYFCACFCTASAARFCLPCFAGRAVGQVIVDAFQQMNHAPVNQLADPLAKLAAAAVRIDRHRIVIGHDAAGVEVLGGFDQA